MRVSKELREHLAKLGRRGGKIGGKARWADTTPEERSAHMKRLALEREAARRQRELQPGKMD